MRQLPVVFAGGAEELRRHSRRDVLVNVLLGGLYTSIERRHRAQYLASHTTIDGSPLVLGRSAKSRWPAILLVLAFIAVRVASEFGVGLPLPVVVICGVLLVLGFAWAACEPTVAALAATQTVDARVAAAAVAAAVVAFPLLAALAIYGVSLLVIVLLSIPARAWYEAQVFAMTWNGLRVGERVRVTCALDARGFARMRTADAWRTLRTLGAHRAQAIVNAYVAKLSALTVAAE